MRPPRTDSCDGLDELENLDDRWRDPDRDLCDLFVRLDVEYRRAGAVAGRIASGHRAAHAADREKREYARSSRSPYRMARRAERQLQERPESLRFRGAASASAAASAQSPAATAGQGQ